MVKPLPLLLLILLLAPHVFAQTGLDRGFERIGNFFESGAERYEKLLTFSIAFIFLFAVMWFGLKTVQTENKRPLLIIALILALTISLVLVTKTDFTIFKLKLIWIVLGVAVLVWIFYMVLRAFGMKNHPLLAFILALAIVLILLGFITNYFDSFEINIGDTFDGIGNIFKSDTPENTPPAQTFDTRKNEVTSLDQRIKALRVAEQQKRDEASQLRTLAEATSDETEKQQLLAQANQLDKDADSIARKRESLEREKQEQERQLDKDALAACNTWEPDSGSFIDQITSFFSGDEANEKIQEYSRLQDICDRARKQEPTNKDIERKFYTAQDGLKYYQALKERNTGNLETAMQLMLTVQDAPATETRTNTIFTSKAQEKFSEIFPELRDRNSATAKHKFELVGYYTGKAKTDTTNSPSWMTKAKNAAKLAQNKLTENLNQEADRSDDKELLGKVLQWRVANDGLSKESNEYKDALKLIGQAAPDEPDEPKQPQATPQTIDLSGITFVQSNKDVASGQLQSIRPEKPLPAGVTATYKTTTSLKEGTDFETRITNNQFVIESKGGVGLVTVTITLKTSGNELTKGIAFNLLPSELDWGATQRTLQPGQTTSLAPTGLAPGWHLGISIDSQSLSRGTDYEFSIEKQKATIEALDGSEGTLVVIIRILDDQQQVAEHTYTITISAKAPDPPEEDSSGFPWWILAIIGPVIGVVLFFSTEARRIARGAISPSSYKTIGISLKDWKSRRRRAKETDDREDLMDELLNDIEAIETTADDLGT